MSKQRNPNDLIRIEDAIRVLCRRTCHPGVFCPDIYCTEMWDEFEDVKRVDAVPVVRCDKCNFWDRDHISCEGLAKCLTGESGIRYRSRNDFCSSGRMRG